MPLKPLNECLSNELGHKGSSLLLMWQHGICVPDAWLWVTPRLLQDLLHLQECDIRKIILRVSEPLGCDPQESSGSSISSVYAFASGDLHELEHWLSIGECVIVQRYVEANAGGAAHVRESYLGRVVVHLSCALDVSHIMEGSESGVEMWIGDIPPLDGTIAPLLISRSDDLPLALASEEFAKEFMSEIRPLALGLGVPFEVEWVIGEDGRIVFLQLLELKSIERTEYEMWVHPDAATYFARGG